MQELWKDKLEQEGFSLGFDGLELNRVLVDKKKNQVTVCFNYDKLPDEILVSQLRRALRRTFVDASVSVRIACPALALSFIKEPAKYMPAIAAMLSVRAPALASHLRGAKCESDGNTITVSVTSQTALDYMRARNGAEQISGLLHELFSADFNVQLALQDVDTKAMLEQLARERLEADLKLAQAAEAAAPKKAKAPEPGQPLYGNAFKGSATPMRELTEETGRVIIEGRIFKHELRRIAKETRALLTFSITDNTGSISCKIITEVENEGPLNNIKSGMAVRVKGDVSYDKFLREISMRVDAIMPHKIPVRNDDAEEKRIELHLHTTMSSMDAVSSPKALINRAAAWGHEAIAITDHGVVQSFPEAFAAAKKANIRLIPGVEGYLTDDMDAIAANGGALPIDIPIVVVDFEMTGSNAAHDTDRIIEIGAVKIENGRITDEFATFVDPGIPIPENITSLTGISDDMVYGKPDIKKAIADFCEFAKDCPICAHDVHVEESFINRSIAEAGGDLPITKTFIDTLSFSRALYPDFKSHKLDQLAKELGIILSKHHRASADARATAEILIKMLAQAKQDGAKTLSDLNTMYGTRTASKAKSYHIILLAKNQKGLENLYRLISTSHLDYFGSTPRMPRSVIEKNREGLIVGSACEAGELYQAVLAGKNDTELKKIASFYDYLEIQPLGNNEFMLRKEIVKSRTKLQNLNKKIYELGKEMGKPVVATGDVHFMDPEDAFYREVLMTGKGFDDAEFQPPLYFKTTNEMLEDFNYFPPEIATELVIDAPRQILAMCEPVTLFPKHPEGKVTFQPELYRAAEEIEGMSWGNAKRIYGDPLPDIVQKRVEKELNSIIGYGFATLYYSAHLLIKKSNSDGYLVGSRGSVGSSFVATMCNITEVNPLPPHYVCPNCQYSDFDIDTGLYPCGIDLPEKDCPVCGHKLDRNGFDIPFEVFLGFKGDKVPDIDLNFSGVYQGKAHAYVEELYGAGNVFKAGTISTLGEKKAFGYAAKYFEERGIVVTTAEKERIVEGIKDVKYNTGQHPGGMVIIPKDREVYQFCPIQNPADKAEKGIITTHFDFNSMHDIVVKLDILGHDDPTMIRMLEDLSGLKATELPLNDPETMEIFQSPKSLGLTAEELGCSTGSLGIPEFGTKFVIGMLEDTKPSTMGELVRISGLSHGTNVWLGNAQEIVRQGIGTLRDCFCTRDDIMNALIKLGVEPFMAFSTMESVRKGKGLTEQMEAAMREKDVPEWMIDSCKKIGYMFPRAHAAAYVMMGLRVAWFKVHRPIEYYTAYYTVRADTFDASIMCTDAETVKRAIDSIKAQGKQASAKDQDLVTELELVREMFLRGIEFAPMDLYQSEALDFKIVDGKILPPINALPGVGEAAAISVVEARKDGPYLSVEEFASRAKVSKSVVDALRQQGCFRGIPETSQVTFFD